MALDICKESLECIRLLREAGRTEDAEALDRAQYGSTSGEILCDTGIALQAALKRRPRLTGLLRDRLRALERECARAFKTRG